jgi:hypothetical protein
MRMEKKINKKFLMLLLVSLVGCGGGGESGEGDTEAGASKELLGVHNVNLYLVESSMSIEMFDVVKASITINQDATRTVINEVVENDDGTTTERNYTGSPDFPIEVISQEANSRSTTTRTYKIDQVGGKYEVVRGYTFAYWTGETGAATWKGNLIEE